MIRLPRLASVSALALVAALLSSASPSFAAKSSSASFQNLRSAFDAAGGKASGSAFSQTNTMGEVATTTLSATSFMARSGLVPIYFFPSRIDDLAAYGCVSSQVTLQWTAPGNDGKAPGTKARTYLIRMSNDPLLSPAASETLFYSATPVAASAPKVQGSTETLTVGGLTDGVTYYFAIIALEADLSAGPLSPGGTFYLGGAMGPAPENFAALSGFKMSELGWSKTVSAIPGCTPVAYRLYRSTDPNNTFAVVNGTGTVGIHYEDSGVLAGSTFYYRLIGLDGGSNEMTVPANAFVYVHSAPPTPPLRFELAVHASSNTLTWQAPVAHEIGIRFLDGAHARPDELDRFIVWRSTSLLNAQWTQLASVSSQTLTYTDNSPVANAYYKVTAHNITDDSLPSWIRDQAVLDGYAVAPDRKSHIFVPKAVLAGVYASPAGYWVRPSSSNVTAGVYNTGRWDLYDQYAQKDTLFRFPDTVQVRLSYQTDSSGKLQAAGAGVQSYEVAAAAPTEDQATLFWNNGADWVKMYGSVDSTNKWVVAQSHFGGDYQIRAIARLQNVDFDISNISNKFLTPNGDGKNDNVVFTLDNPRQSEISGKIFDVRGRHVADMTRFTSGNPTQMLWDGRANGATVPSGVYIYQLEGDGKTFNGTLVVVK